MKNMLLFLMAAYVMMSCADSRKTEADMLLANIEQLYDKGCYKAALDSIVKLRERFPNAVEPRRKALDIWQKASLKMAQADVLHTDSLLQSTLRKIDEPGSLLTKNLLRMRRDSLRGRYDAMCGVVRMIRKRMAEDGNAGGE